MGVNLKALLTGIETTYAGQVAGFGVAIYRSGKLELSTSGGWKIIGQDKYTSRTRQSMGSMGKTISAAAIVRALQAAGKTVDDPIAGQLPAGWKLGPNADRVTYRMVLTHTTGIPDGVYTNQQLRDFFAVGFAMLPALSFYANSNYDLTRILLPFLAHQVLYQDDWEAMLGPTHIKFVKANVLKPCGLTDVDVYYRWSDGKTRYYPDPAKPKEFHESNTLAEAEASIGAGWWTMSVREYGRFIDRLRHEAALPGVWKTMRDSAATSPGAGGARLGMFTMPPAPDGDVYWHNGGFSGSESAWVALPDGITVVVSANSAAPGAPQDVIRAAYDAALT